MKRAIVIKVIAALLILGGIAGIIVSALTWLELSTTNATAGFLVIIFGLSIWVGVNLWRGIPQAYTWSKILFALQIPAITSSGLVYQFYTAVMLCLTFERQPDTKLAWTSNWGPRSISWFHQIRSISQWA